MNYIQHLTNFLDMVKSDQRLTPQHITLYISLFYYWNRAYFQNPIPISRNEIMELAHIGSTHTYAKCIKQLHAWKYIRYVPSFNPQKPSMVHLCILKADSSVKNDTGRVSKMKQVACQKWHRSRVKSDTGRVSKMLPYINNTNNKKQEIEHEQKSNSNLLEMKKENTTPETRVSVSKVSDVPPPLDHVKIYFGEKGYADQEAEKFFNYFESTGWLVGGRTKMRDWKAAARNWMLNIKKFNQPKPSPNQIINPNKSYDIPL
ncbi:MAG: hypothetical protein JXR39_08820 [Marinilabiliaceae bacterium]|nr:hypothetical protein [Marinilabiliaceae bacterium]